MTRRAALMLAALEDGCSTRSELWAHAGRFYLTNNAASDLRKAGVDVAWDRAKDSYSLVLSEGVASPAQRSDPPPSAPFAEDEAGQLVFA